MSLICPGCNGKYDENLGCTNPSCKFKERPTFAVGVNEEQKQFLLNELFKKWQNRNNSSQGESPYVSADSDLYSLGWGTEHPGHLTILIDLSQSMSMENGWNKNVDDVLDAVTVLLDELKSSGIDDDEIMPRFSVTVLGYNSKVFTLFKGGVEELIEKFNSIPEGTAIFNKEKEAKPQYQTYTSDAFSAAIDDVTEWIQEQRNERFPVPAPIVIHITDGKPEEEGKSFEQSCAAAVKEAKRLQSIMADDGNTLLFNIHFNNATKSNSPILFPSNPPEDKFMKFLYEVSSTLVPKFVSLAQEKFELPATIGSKGMISNCKDKTMLLRFITWSSQTTSSAETPMI